jgi:hypothetical protein
VAFSSNQGSSFSNPIRFDSGQPQGRVDVLWVNDRQIIASWLEAEDDKSTLVYRRVNMDGKMSELKKVVTLEGGRGIGYPQMEMVGEKLTFMWTDSNHPSQIQFTLVNMK